jgi:hypothetical protein
VKIEYEELDVAIRHRESGDNEDCVIYVNT